MTLLKEVQQTSTVTGVQSTDFLVNGVLTEIKELPQMTVGESFGRNLVNKIRQAAKQEISVIIDGTKQAGFTREAAE